MKKAILLLVTLIFFALPFVHAQQRYDSPDARSQSENAFMQQQAPNFKVISLEGDTLELDRLKGKVVVLNFWFSTCRPCLREIPCLNQLVEKYGREKVAYLAVSVNDTREELQYFFDFLKDPARNRRIPARSFEFTAIPDANEHNVLIARNLYGVRFYPTTYLIDQAGKIVMTAGALGTNSGEETDEQFDQKLATLLAGE